MGRTERLGVGRSLSSSGALPWLVFAILSLILIGLMPVAYWRSSGVGPQVQVPMFYDAHYLFPRPWTQEHAAPGVPDPAPIAFYSDNRISQSFVAGADQLAMVSVWLAGPQDSPVSITLNEDEGRQWQGELLLSSGLDGTNYFLSFPAIADAAGKTFSLTLTAPLATAEHPVTTRSVGGDRFGHTLRVNEFIRPGNLALMTYSRDWPGRWWVDALWEQLLPSVFRLRLQQYKPTAFKGGSFSWLLLLTAFLGIMLLAMASPRRLVQGGGLARSLGWTLAIILGGLLLWQLLDGRAVISSSAVSLTASGDAQSETAPTPATTGPRLMGDLVNDLWTAVREPEARLVTTEILQGLPAIRVPGSSHIEYAVIVPPQSRVRFATAAQGEGSVTFEVGVGDEALNRTTVVAGAGPTSSDLVWEELDLQRWAGEGVTLSLQTASENDDVQGIWFMPQIVTDAPWLLTDPPPAPPALPSGAKFDNTLELLGVSLRQGTGDADDELVVQLQWRPLGVTDRSGKVFIHLLDGNDLLVAQHDALPVGGAYPTTIWQPGTIVLDEHRLPLGGEAAAGPYRLAIGIYDPDSLARWATTGVDGTIIEDGRAIVELPLEALP